MPQGAVDNQRHIKLSTALRVIVLTILPNSYEKIALLPNPETTSFVAKFTFKWPTELIPLKTCLT